MGRPKKINTVLAEAEIAKAEELQARKKKLLKEQAETLRQERALAEAEDPGETEETEDRPGPGEAVSEDLLSVIEDLQDDSRFFVYKVQENGETSKLGSYSVSEWPERMEKVAKKAGGGNFKILFKDGHGRTVKQTTQTFDTDFYKQEDEEKKAGSDLMTLLMSQAQEARREAAEARRESAETMRTLITAMMAPKAETGLFKSAQDVAAIGALFKGNDKTDPMETLRMGIELGMKMSEGKEPASTLDKVLETMAPAALQLMSRIQPKGAPAARPAASPAPAALPKPLEPPTPESAAEDPIKAHPFYKQYVPKILAAAKGNEPAGEWAEMITDIVPGIYHPHLVGIMEKPDLVEFLGSYEPEARNYAPWIVALRDEVLKLFPVEEGEERETKAVPRGPEAPTGPLPDAVLEAVNG